jgi:hypothetical protein
MLYYVTLRYATLRYVTPPFYCSGVQCSAFETCHPSLHFPSLHANTNTNRASAVDAITEAIAVPLLVATAAKAALVGSVSLQTSVLPHLQ